MRIRDFFNENHFYRRKRRYFANRNKSIQYFEENALVLSILNYYLNFKKKDDWHYRPCFAYGGCNFHKY
ncbi:MAG: hypothetical protein ACI85O_003646 [Saprospiraceae bacterium]|jgi:hypothetical protein